MQNQCKTAPSKVGSAGQASAPLVVLSRHTLYLFSQYHIRPQPNPQNGPRAPLRGCAAGSTSQATTGRECCALYIRNCRKDSKMLVFVYITPWMEPKVPKVSQRAPKGSQRIPKWSQNPSKIHQNGSQNRHERQGRFWMAKMTLKRIQNGAKRKQNGTQRIQNATKSYQNGTTREPKGDQSESKSCLGRQGRFWEPFWNHFGTILGAILVQIPVTIRKKHHPKII